MSGKIHVRRIRLLIIGLGVGVFLGAALFAAWLVWPTSTSERREIAANMIQFYNQPHPNGIFNEDLPESLTERDRQHYDSLLNDPVCDVHPDYMALEYSYRRFGVDYTHSFFIMRGPWRKIYPLPYLPDTDDKTWILKGERSFSLFDHLFQLKDRPIIITNGP